MSDKETGGSAFPAMGQHYGPKNHDGMTLRDYFAAKVIQGFIAGSMADGSELDVAGAPIIAKMAFMVADAMLAERAK